jgi:uncharacterized protein YukE
MSDILVRPPELRAAATELRSHAKQIQSAIDTLSTVMQSVMAGRFEGQRAATLFGRYRSKRLTLLFTASLVTRFAQELEEAAVRFEQADRGESGLPFPRMPFPPGGPVPMPMPVPPRTPFPDLPDDMLPPGQPIPPRWPEIPDDGWRIPPNWPIPKPEDPKIPWDEIFPDGVPSPPPNWELPPDIPDGPPAIPPEWRPLPGYPNEMPFPEEPKAIPAPYYRFSIPDDWQTQPPSIEFADNKPEGSVPTWINYLINLGWRYENGSWTNSEG